MKCFIAFFWGTKEYKEMLVIDLDIRTDNDMEPVPMFMTQILTRKVMQWLHGQGLEGDVTIKDHTARILVMTDGWKEDDYDPFADRLRQAVFNALKVE
jgi:hypothetical protein